MKETIKNQFFMLKFCFNEAPGHFVFHIIMGIGLELFIFLEHTLWIGYNLAAVEKNESFRNIIILTIGMFVILLFHQFVTAVYYHWSIIKVKPILYQKMQEKIYTKAKNVDLECYDNPNYYNEFILATAQVEQCVDKFYDNSHNFIRYVTCLIVDCIYLSINNIWSILVVIVCCITKYVASKKYFALTTEKMIDASISQRKRNYQHRVFYLQDYAKELRLNKEMKDLFLQDFEKCNDELNQNNKKYGKKLVFYGFLKDYISGYFIIYAVFLPCLIYYSWNTSQISLSTIVVLVNMVRYMSRKGNRLAELFPQIAMNSKFIEKIRNFMNYELKVKDGNENIEGEMESISLKHVWFSYTSGGKDILQDICIEIKKGQKVAIVGYNGAGKSTLIKLIMRLYDPDKGEIQRNGKNIRNFKIKEYRKDIGAVFQDYNIYAMTLRENVVMDTCLENEKETREVLKALSDAKFTLRNSKLKHQIETPLTTEFDSDGINLSGGEGQKVAVSRTMYRKNSLIIMDEPSSALDPLAEYQINQTLREAAKDNIVIYISHRLSTTRDADYIYMMEQGKIIEQGNHEELLAIKGEYYRMWNAQAGKYN